MARQTRSTTAAAKATSGRPPSNSSITAASKKKGSSKVTAAFKVKKEDEENEQPETPARANISRKRTRGSAIKQEDGVAASDILDDEPATPDTARPKKRTRKNAKAKDLEVKAEEAGADIKQEEAAEDKEVVTPKKKASKKKTEKFGPGITPYPDWPYPTDEMCREVIRVLEKEHGKAEAPKEIPVPSLKTAGCGEVPNVISALVRTRLSANTTNKNSSTAFQGLVKRFGTIKEGIGKGDLDWNAVRTAPYEDVVEAIKHGGLSKVKGKDIQNILQIAYNENQARKAALEDPSDSAEGESKEPDNAKEFEIEKASQDIISLDHYHLLPTWDAMRKMQDLPGIGWKTSACVAMFCMQRPVFAVDTHVFRLCQYLGWLPKKPKAGEPKIGRDECFFHCDAMIPDDCKYALHQLLIRHGKNCPRCRAATGASSADWGKGCVIEHLVSRHGDKKGGSSKADKDKARKAAGLGSDEVKEEKGKGGGKGVNGVVKERHGEVEGEDAGLGAEVEDEELSELESDGDN